MKSILKYFTSLQTPDGVIWKRYWRSVLEVEKKNFYNMKVAYKLTPDHVDPKYFQKMNVPVAFCVCTFILFTIPASCSEYISIFKTSKMSSFFQNPYIQPGYIQYD